MLDDLLAVADAAKAARFHLWGYGHGGAIGRYLAARSDRVISGGVVGTPMGPPVDGMVRDAIVGMRAKWMPVVEAQAAGTLDRARSRPATGRPRRRRGGVHADARATWSTTRCSSPPRSRCPRCG